MQDIFYEIISKAKDGFNIVSLPYEIDGNLHINNSGKNCNIENELLDDVVSSISL